jgi:hypothetical protein
MAGQEAVWHVVIDDDQQGPLTKGQVLEHLKDGLLTSSDLIWRPGFPDWKSIREVSDFWQPPKRPSARDAVQQLPLPAAALDQPTRLTAWQRLKTHLGSSLAFIAGGLSIVSGISRVVTTPDANSFEPGSSMPEAGAVMILGALAYRSAKNRRIGEAKSTFIRHFLEIASLVLICFVILMQNNLKYLIATDPVPNAVIPIWAILAYLAVVFIPKKWLLRSSRD